jgi:hypothetical protein
VFVSLPVSHYVTSYCAWPSEHFSSIILTGPYNAGIFLWHLYLALLYQVLPICWLILGNKQWLGRFWSGVSGNVVIQFLVRYYFMKSVIMNHLVFRFLNMRAFTLGSSLQITKKFLCTCFYAFPVIWDELSNMWIVVYKILQNFNSAT